MNPELVNFHLPIPDQFSVAVDSRNALTILFAEDPSRRRCVCQARQNVVDA
jgi:hypothetical protein